MYLTIKVKMHIFYVHRIFLGIDIHIRILEVLIILNMCPTNIIICALSISSFYFISVTVAMAESTLCQ